MTNEIFDYPELLESNEELIPLTEACKKFRPPVSRPTIGRYVRVGVRDVILRTVKVGGCRSTTLSEIKRFSLAQLENPAPQTDESIKDTPKRSAKKSGGGMTAEEISAGLARHGLE